MQTNWRNYTSDDSDARLVEILDAPAGAYETVDSIPDRARLTYANGFYVNCTAVFIDIRGSSDLTTLHRTPVLGKIYRSYISECVALLNTSRQCREIFIAGDCVSGIFDTPLKADIEEAFLAAASLNSLIDHLNWRLDKKGYTPIKCGVGISYGRALMLKSGYSGSGINDVVWMGDVVNDASNLCHKGNKDGSLPVQVATVVHQNLCANHQELLSPVTPNIFQAATHYQGNIFNTGMRRWLTDKKISASMGLSSAALLGLPNLGQQPPQTLLGLFGQPSKIRRL
jgi:class 3 adenylate cyclase